MRISFLYLSLLCVGSVAAVAQAPQTVQSLLNDLAKPQTTNQAAAVLLKMAQAQPSVVEELSHALPPLLLNSTDAIDGPGDSVPKVNVVVSEASLAGKLQLVSAIPALIQALDRPTVPFSNTDFTEAEELLDDPVARALADIGAPAVPALNQPLESGNFDTRERAARILVLINTPESLSLLQQHIDRETDSGLKRYIAAKLESARAKQEFDMQAHSKKMRISFLYLSLFCVGSIVAIASIAHLAGKFRT
jgi:hypothetical protein